MSRIPCSCPATACSSRWALVTEISSAHRSPIAITPMLATGKRYIKIDFPTPLEKKREAWSVISFPSASLATGHWPLATLLSPLLFHGLLHVLDVRTGEADEHQPLAEVGPQGDHHIGGPERSPQQAVGVQALKPLGVEHIGLGSCPATGGLPRLDETDLEALSFQQLEKWDPVDPGRLNGDSGYAALLEPGGDLEQITGIGAEGADIFCVAVGGHADNVVVGVDIDGCGVGVDDWHRGGRLASRRGATFGIASGHDGSPLIRGQVESQNVPTRSGRRPRKRAASPTGSGEPVTNDKVASSCDHVVQAGTRAPKLGRPGPAPATISVTGREIARRGT